MSRLVWHELGEKFYETGVKKGVLYPQTGGAYPKGVAWHGLTSVSESPSGAEASPFYADDTKYLNLIGNEEFGGTIEAYMSPKEFDECDGTKEIAPGVTVGQQARKAFGFSFTSVIGNDTDGNDHGYKIHLVYGAMASPSERSYTAIGDSTEPMTLSWEFTTTPVKVTGAKPTALLTIDSTKVDADKLAELEDILYGTDEDEARLPLPDEVAQLLGSAA